MPKLDLAALPVSNSTGYPAPFDAEVQGRWQRRIANAGGLTDFGARHVVLKPGAWSSQRHWHNGEDEMLVMLSGEAVLVEDPDTENGGRSLLRSGDVCVWPKGSTNGHHLINESMEDCTFVTIGGGTCTGGGYSDIDLKFNAEGQYLHKDGTPY
ncbi:MAG: cupin domain-containing protein [Novosphingobium sp.]